MRPLGALGTNSREQPGYGPATRAGVVSRIARIRRGIGLECGGKRSATPLWIGEAGTGNYERNERRETGKGMVAAEGAEVHSAAKPQPNKSELMNS